jgi:GTP cyclohydrolase I
MYSRRPQVQERLTTQIADAMVDILDPLGVIVIIDCEHLCMSMRGVKKSNARTTTSAVRGVLQNMATRAEAISLITIGKHHDCYGHFKCTHQYSFADGGRHNVF